MSWLWGCMIISFKAALGYALWSLGITLIVLLIGLIGSFIQRNI